MIPTSLQRRCFALDLKVDTAAVVMDSSPSAPSGAGKWQLLEHINSLAAQP